MELQCMVMPCHGDGAEQKPRSENRNPPCPTKNAPIIDGTHNLYRSRLPRPYARFPGHAWRVSRRLRRQGTGEDRSAAVSANNILFG